jgi:hypothetical protein
VKAILLVAAAVAIVAVAVVLLTSGGGSSHNAATTSPKATVTTVHVTHAKVKSKPAAKQTQTPALSPAETTVTVLNGTETTGLAHHVSAELQQTGYSQAAALDGRPPGANQVTVVQYSSGHQAEAQGVARSLSVSKVEPMEASVAALANSADVVVVVGADKATPSP